MRPYYADESVTLFCGDCREITEWLAADLVITDPPYGTDKGDGYARGITRGKKLNPGAGIKHRIAGDTDTTVRDDALAMLTDDQLAIIGVELEERYCEVIARRLAQDVLPFEPSEVG